MKDWLKKWLVFLKTIIDPWLILTVALIVLLTIFLNSNINAKISNTAIDNANDSLIITLVTVFISIFSAVAGSIIQKNISRLNEEDSLITRGKVSIRSLKLILGNLYSFGNRIKLQMNNSSIAKLSDLDVFERIIILQEELLSSIENWTDIIPEADVKSQIGIISKLQEQIINIEKEKDNIIAELKDESTKTTVEKAQLEKRLQQIKQSLIETQLKVENKASSFMGYSSSIINQSMTAAELIKNYGKDDSTLNAVQDYNIKNYYGKGNKN